MNQRKVGLQPVQPSEHGISVSAVHSQDSALHPTQLLSMQETQKLSNFRTDWMELLSTC